LAKDVNLELANLEFSKSRFKSYFGNIGELIAEEILFKEGFEVCRWRPYNAGDILPQSNVSRNLRRCLNCLYPIKPDETVTMGGEKYHITYSRDPNYKTIIKELNDFFGDKLSNFKKYTDTLGFGEAKEVRYIPDLVAKKDNEIYIVEVKTNSGNIYLKREQEKLKGLLSARKFDLIPLLININIRLEATDFTMKELE